MSAEKTFDYQAAVNRANEAFATSPPPDYSIVHNPDGSRFLFQPGKGSVTDLGSIEGAIEVLGIVRRSFYSDRTAIKAFMDTVDNRDKPADYLERVGTSDDEIDQIVACYDEAPRQVRMIVNGDPIFEPLVSPGEFAVDDAMWRMRNDPNVAPSASVVPCPVVR